MRVNRALLVTVAVAAATACGAQDDMDAEATAAPGAEVGPAQTAAPTVSGQNAMLASGQFEAAGDEGMNVQGTAELRRSGGVAGGDVELAVQLTGLSDGQHAWHIHQGSCDNRGSVVLPLSDAPSADGVAGDLEPDETGRADRTVTLDSEDLELLRGGESYSVNIHARGSDSPGPAVACATIDLPADVWGQAGSTAAGAATAGGSE